MTRNFADNDFDRDHGRDGRYRGYGDRYAGDYAARDRHTGRQDDRGFVERAGDEVRSWFRDDDAERRRTMDDIHEYQHSRGPAPEGHAGRDRAGWGPRAGDMGRQAFVGGERPRDERPRDGRFADGRYRDDPYRDDRDREERYRSEREWNDRRSGNRFSVDRGSNYSYNHHSWRGHHDNGAGVALGLGLGLFALAAIASQNDDRYYDYRPLPPPPYRGAYYNGY